MARLVSIIILGAVVGAAFQNCSSALPEEAKGTQASLGESPLSIQAATTELAGSATLQLSGAGGAPPYTLSVVTGSGTLDASNLFTAPATTETNIVQITDGRGRTAALEIKVTAALKLATSSTLATEKIKLTAEGGHGPYTFQLLAGIGTLAGDEFTPGATAPATTLLQVTDAKGVKAQLSINVTMPAKIAMYKLSDTANGGSVLNTDPNIGSTFGFASQGVVFNLFQAAPATDSIALTKCNYVYNYPVYVQYVPAGRACPAYYTAVAGAGGYMSTVARPNTVPLYAPAAYPHLISRSASEYAIYGNVGIIGYVLP